ncbi:MAG: phage portal protein [Thermoguttaceae bacterium]|nr:phage portal protein [Thermoguttaceae bacterium]
MGFFADLFAKPERTSLKATHYDATSLDDLNEYWRWTNSKSVDASLDPETRRKLRERARYEVANNSYAMGVALALSDAVVGSGPRLQVLELEKELAKRIEWDFCEWMERIDLASKLRAMRIAKFQDGESFAVLYSNEGRDDSLPKLDVMPIDAERVAGDYGTNDETIDGIKLDEWGNPVSYRVLNEHPGSLSSEPQSEATTYPAASIIHWYRRTLPEQHRGAPEIAASLNLFALLRRYTFAVVAAAETAADVAAFLTAEPDSGAYDRIMPNAMEELEIRRNKILTLPEGCNIQQLRAEQPTTTYGDFKRELLGEIGRSLQIPVNLISGNSSGYNYASGRLDHQEFQKAIRLQQSQASVVVMTPIFRAWFREWALANVPTLRDALVPIQWYWDGFEHVDPVKEAQAQAVRLANGVTNLQIEFGKQGRDWEDALDQLYKERAISRELARKHGVQDIFGATITPEYQGNVRN